MDLIFIISAILYIPLIFSLKFYIDKSPNKDYIRNILEPYNCLWDFGLAIFSGLGAYNCYMQIFKFGYNCSYINNIFWVKIFCLSKIPELLDTVFIVLRSKPLVLLQYYHHLATLILCGLGIKVYPKETLLAALMNYTVHFFMYGYFALYGLGFKKIRKYGFLITILQTLQMVIAVYVLMSTRPVSCIDTTINTDFLFWYSFIMYSSYVVLFGQLLLKKI